MMYLASFIEQLQSLTIPAVFELPSWMHILLYYFFFGHGFSLLLFLVPLFMYVFWSTSILIIQAYVLKKREAHASLRSFWSALVQCLLALTILLGLNIYLAGVWITYDPTERGDIAANDDLLMRADKYLFGVYIPFWLHQTDNPYKSYLDTLAPVFINAYKAMSSMLGLAFLFLMFFSTSNFVRMLLAFFISSFIAIPLWYWYPALSPLDGYLRPLIEVSVSEDIKDVLRTFHPNHSTQSFIDWVSSLNESQTTAYLPTTTMPSMHIAWATLIAYFLARAWKPTLFFVIPYSFLNLIATVYTLQHYTVDLIAGFALAFLSIALSYTVPFARFRALKTLLDKINHDVAQLCKFIKPHLRTLARAAKVSL